MQIVLTKGFAELGVLAKAVHCVALSSVAVATMLLMTPAAYHRIVYDGADIPAFYHIASRFLIAATAFLALGLAADIHVVIGKITESPAVANVTAVVVVLMLVGCWHLWPWWKRLQNGGV
ncbi:DUF6328 family protein (plasmid) [Ensifer adhaerens]|nr:DUF6328 family protein [Ensifer adhaerens]UAY05640.1 DUF6328 family protein [Ensifer adhaerens]UAY13018.1 DUF6328 family protein [Ensifer adhaerens]